MTDNNDTAPTEGGILEIGEIMNLTRERVRQIQIDALKALRAMIESHGISGDMILD